MVLLGSAPLLIERGLTESLAGRFETLHLPHWSLEEVRAAFSFSLEDYLYFGGYPGAAPLSGEPARWRRYVLDALVEISIARDVLLLTRVDKPALLRRLFELGCRYSGQVLSYTRMVGQLQDAPATPRPWPTTSSCWRERNREVDFVVRAGKRLIAIEVKSGRRRDTLPGMDAFTEAFHPSRTLLVGADGVAVEALLSRPVEQWLAA